MNKIKAIILLTILYGALSSPLLFVHAQDNPASDLGASTPKISAPIDFPKLSVKLPGLNFDKAICTDTECTNNWLAEYIQALYQYGIGIIGILAVITMMIGGIVWVTAAGNDQRIGEAKKWIGGSLMGVLIALTSYVVLNMVNPALTELSPIKIAYIEREDLPDITEYQEFIDNNGSLSTELKQAPTNIVSVDVETSSGLKRIQVDQTIAELVKKTMKEVKDKGYKIYEIGGYRPSKMCHGYGLAIDINTKENYCVDCYGKKGAKVPDNGFYRPPGAGAGSDYTLNTNSIPKEIVEIFKKNGWCWGGDWKSIKDYMHFSVPTCRNGAECGARGKYDFNESVRKNHLDLSITYP